MSADGSVVQRIDYDEYGRVTQNTHPGFQPFGFAGGLYDDAKKLVRFGARDYEAEIGRWTAKDPIGFAGGAGNPIAYAVEDPIIFSDVEGLQILNPLGAFVGFAGEPTIQAIANYRWGCEIFDISNYDWTDVATSTGIGLIAPDAFRVARTVRNSSGAIGELTRQLGRTPNVTRVAKLEGRMAGHEFAIGDAVKAQVSLQAAKAIAKGEFGKRNCRCVR